MTRKVNLAVVDESTPAPRRKSVSQAARSGDRLELMRALRDKIASEITSGVAPRDLASLSRRLIELSKEIESLADIEEDDPVTVASRAADEAWQAL